MTNEEKAEEYVMREDVDTMKYSECYNERVFFEKEVKKAYLDGLAEGRKEICQICEKKIVEMNPNVKGCAYRKLGNEFCWEE